MKGNVQIAITEDNYIVTLENTHLGWGTYRYKDSRDRIYIKIPANEARRIGLYNSNTLHVGLGFNEFRFTTSDGFL